MIFQRFHYICVCRPLRWHSSNICDVTTVQLSNRTVHKVLQNFTLHELYLPSSFILRYVRAEMNVHAYNYE